MAEKIRYPDVVVVVPRAAFEQYWRRPWSEVVAAAEAGTDGLSTWTGQHLSDRKAGTAWLRPAWREERSLQGLALLYSQGW